MSVTPLTCADCPAKLVYGGRGRPPSRCPSCRAAAYSAYRRGGTADRKAGRIGRPCAGGCGAQVTGRANYCGSPCVGDTWTGPRPLRDPIGCANPRCQVTIERPRHGQKWCSKRCRQRVQERVASDPDRVQGHNARSNAKRPGRQTGAFVKLRVRVRAEESTCWVCGDGFDKRKHWPDPMCFTVDHVIPIEDGGPELDRANLRAAHRTCNQRRHVEWRRAQRERRRVSA